MPGPMPCERLVFIGVKNGGSLNLTPLLDDPAGRWKAGATMSAATAFGALVADARASKGLPI
jgi:hypothetical protein